MGAALIAFGLVLSGCASNVAQPSLRSESQSDSARQADSAPVDVADCRTAAEAAEDERGIPHGLLIAVAAVESGMDPLALRVGGHSLHPDTRQQAAHLAQTALRQSKSVMAGCMQVNLLAHDREGALWALDPQHAADWAADQLVSLRAQLRSWHAAVRAYGGGAGPAYLYRVLSRQRAIIASDRPDEVAQAP